MTTLTNADATLENIRKNLKALAANATADSSVTIFFSGHGATLSGPSTSASALLPVDGDLSSIGTTCLMEDEFSAALAAIPSQRLLVLLDACYSGGAASFKSPLIDNFNWSFSEKSLAKLAQGAGRVLIASSRSTETSVVFDGAQNSLFTTHLLDALSGRARSYGDGLVRVFELFNYVAVNVRREMPGAQHPILKASNLEDNFPIALYKGGRKSASQSEQTTPVEPDVWKRLEQTLSKLYPAGPTDQDIWARAGGDIARLKLVGSGRSQWFSALQILRLGGGGEAITLKTIVEAALEEFPREAELMEMRVRTEDSSG